YMGSIVFKTSVDYQVNTSFLQSFPKKWRQYIRAQKKKAGCCNISLFGVLVFPHDNSGYLGNQFSMTLNSLFSQ
ncbi:MAG: hypothetical protein V1769_07335, partial [Thermoplasmatota archaeon]